MLYQNLENDSVVPFGWLIKHWTGIGRTSLALGIVAFILYAITTSTPTILAYVGMCGIAFGAFAIFSDRLSAVANEQMKTPL